MSFSSTIPNSSDNIAKSSLQMRANFQAISEAFAANHVPLNNTGQLGKHQAIIFQAVNSDPATSATTLALYNKVVGSSPQLFYRPASNATSYQLTYNSVSTNPASKQQYSFIAGPFIVYCGLLTGLTRGQTITLTPSSTLVYVGLNATKGQVMSTTGNYTYQMSAESLSSNQFTVQYQANSFSTLDAYYIALGIP